VGDVEDGGFDSFGVFLVEELVQLLSIEEEVFVDASGQDLGEPGVRVRYVPPVLLELLPEPEVARGIAESAVFSFDGAELACEDVLRFVFPEGDFDVAAGAVAFVDFL